jgi:hypothetical protein
MARLIAGAGLLGLLATAAGSLAQPPGYPQALPPNLPLFPRDNWWNVPVTSAPVDATATTRFRNYVGSTRGLHPDFGGYADPGNPSDPSIYGMVYIVVPGTQPLVNVVFDFASQSDNGFPGRPLGYPIPPEARTQPQWIEGGFPGNQDQGEDQHLLIVDRDNRLLYELYQLRWDNGQSRWEAGSGAIWSLDSDDRRPAGWTSADGAGLAILPGLIRHDEAFGSEPIRHAFRFTIQDTQPTHVFPASHTACNSCPDSLPMGARLRLIADRNPVIPEEATPAEVAAIGRIVEAMKTHGLILADNGSNLYIQGTFDPRWNNDVLNPAFDSLEAEDFEVLQLGWQPPAPAPGGGSAFHTVTPCRLIDTRDPPGPWGGPALWPGGSRSVVVGGRCGVPPSAKAIAVNVTAVGAPQTGFLRGYPANLARPNTTVLHFGPGQTRAGAAVLPLSTSGTATLAMASGTTSIAVHWIVDVTGYFE